MLSQTQWTSSLVILQSQIPILWHPSYHHLEFKVGALNLTTRHQIMWVLFYGFSNWIWISIKQTQCNLTNRNAKGVTRCIVSDWVPLDARATFTFYIIDLSSMSFWQWLQLPMHSTIYYAITVSMDIITCNFTITNSNFMAP